MQKQEWYRMTGHMTSSVAFVHGAREERNISLTDYRGCLCIQRNSILLIPKQNFLPVAKLDHLVLVASYLGMML
jgi:hypothetical protein